MKNFQETAEDIMENLHETDADMVFGKARQDGTRTIIPVAKISYGWGGGGGKSKKIDKPEESGSGFGMGMGIKPVGYIEISRDKAAYRPILDYGTISIILSSVLGLMLLRTTKLLLKKGKRG